MGKPSSKDFGKSSSKELARRIRSSVKHGGAPGLAEELESFVESERTHAKRLAYLIGSIIITLESYDADDGHNQIVMAGILAELKEIEGDYEHDA